MRVLVTGSSGLIGDRLVSHLGCNGHSAVRFDLRESPDQDIRSRDALDRHLSGCDGVIHLAAISRVAWGEQNPQLCRDVNVAGTALLIERMKAVGEPWMVFASSREVYGNPPGKLVTEQDPIAPVNIYGQSKADAENVVHQATLAGVQTSIIRLSNVYGSTNDHPDRAIPAILWKALENEPIQLTGGETYFDFVHVEDCCEGIVTAALKLHETCDSLPPIHLTTGIPTSLSEVARLALELNGSNASVELVAPRAFDVSGFCGDPSNAGRLLNWGADVSLRQGMQRLLEDFRRIGRPMKQVEMPC